MKSLVDYCWCSSSMDPVQLEQHFHSQPGCSRPGTVANAGMEAVVGVAGLGLTG